MQFPTGGKLGSAIALIQSAHEPIVKTRWADLVKYQSRRYSPDERRRRHLAILTPFELNTFRNAPISHVLKCLTVS